MSYRPHHIPLENKYSQLLVAQILLLVVPTLFPVEMWSILAYIILVSVVVALTFRILQIGSGTFLLLLGTTIAIGVAEVFLVLLDAYHPRLSILLNGFDLVVTVVAIFFILRKIFGSSIITGDSIRGGICVYFLTGYSFFFIYRMLVDYYPQSFSKPVYLDRLFSLLYFSFTTLTSVGYGDITPASPVTMAIANLEAIFGQMYSATIMARLVSQYLNSR